MANLFYFKLQHENSYAEVATATKVMLLKIGTANQISSCQQTHQITWWAQEKLLVGTKNVWNSCPMSSP